MADGATIHDDFVTREERVVVKAWLSSTHPVWEKRWLATSGDPILHQLPRPILWLGSWQFAALFDNRPSRAAVATAIRAEPFPPVLAGWVARIESRVRARTVLADLPTGWALTACLVHLCGDRVEPDGRREDRAPVQAHRAREQGPVASVSLGERALLEFIDKGGRVTQQSWLNDGDLAVFDGPRHNEDARHRIANVERRSGHRFPVGMDDFDTRRVEFTFRFVPAAHVTPWWTLPEADRELIIPYIDALAEGNAWWRQERDAGNR